MPVTCKLLRGKYRIVEPSGRLARKGNKPVDGGGHETEEACMVQARAINVSLSLSNIAYFPKGTEPWLSLEEDDELVFEKELIYVGEFQNDDMEFKVDESALHHWADTFDQMTKNGVKVPVPKNHTDDPEETRGSVLSMEVRENERGIPALFARIKFVDEEAARMAGTVDVSIMSPPEFVDGKGNRYTRPIRHVALTDYPVIPGLQGFETIAASYVEPKKKEKKMTLEKLMKELGLEYENDAKSASAILSLVKELKGRVEKVSAELEDSKKNKEEKKEEKKDPVTVSASYRGMLRDNRTMKIDRLVEEGKINKAVRDKLVGKYCSDDTLNLVLSHENADDGFDSTIEALGLNEVVKLDGVGTGHQGGEVVALSHADISDPTKNPLLADAERRAKLHEAK